MAQKKKEFDEVFIIRTRFDESLFRVWERIRTKLIHIEILHKFLTSKN